MAEAATSAFSILLSAENSSQPSHSATFSAINNRTPLPSFAGSHHTPSAKEYSQLQPRTTTIMSPPIPKEIVQKNLALKQCRDSTMIDVYVGETKEHFSFPKELLESKSAVFERMLNNGMKESRENKIELPEDAVADFQGLLEYLLGWNPSLIFADDCKREVGVAKCMDWLQYCQKYMVTGPADSVLYVALRKIFTEWGHRELRQLAISGEDVEKIFKATVPSSPLRKLVVSAAITFGGLQNPSRYREQEEHLDGFAAEMNLQMRAALVDRMYICPLDICAKRMDGH